MSSAYLGRLQAFGPLPEADKQALEQIAVDARCVTARTDLCREGELPASAFLFMEGFACRYRQGRDGLRQITAIFMPGDFCDLDVPLLTRSDDNIGAISACKVARIDPLALEDLRQRPALARAMRMVMLADVANTREWLFNVGSRRSTERLAHLLCELYERLNAAGMVKEKTLAFPLTQADLASAASMSTVHLNRSIGNLRKSGLIITKGRRLKIPSISHLKEFCSFDSSYLYLGLPVCGMT